MTWHVTHDHQESKTSDTNGPFAAFAVEFYTICDQKPCGRRLMPPRALLLVNYDGKQHT